METVDSWQVLIVVTLLLAAFGARPIESSWQQLRNELKRLPVYSAETTRRKEAQFISDHSPKRFPLVSIAIALLVLGAAIFWLVRSGA